MWVNSRWGKAACKFRRDENNPQYRTLSNTVNSEKYFVFFFFMKQDFGDGAYFKARFGSYKMSNKLKLSCVCFLFKIANNDVIIN